MADYHYINTQTFDGDVMNENKPENITQIYTQNLNRLKWDTNCGNWPQICKTVAAIHADISCFTELNHDINMFKIWNKIRQIEQRFFQHLQFGGSTSTNKIRQTYKPGGTGMLVIEGSRPPMKLFTNYRMGRWLAAHFHGEQSIKVTIIIAYQICTKTTKGFTTTANCQIAQLIAERQSQLPFQTHAKPSFMTYNNSFTNAKKKEDVILLGDFNTHNLTPVTQLLIQHLQWCMFLPVKLCGKLDTNSIEKNKRYFT